MVFEVKFRGTLCNFQDLDCWIIAVSKDPIESLRTWVAEEFADLATKSSLMPILSDSTGVLARGFGLHHDGEGSRAGYFNAVFIVDGQHRVRYNCLLEAHTAHRATHILRKVAAFRAVEAGDRLVMAGSSSAFPLAALTVENNIGAIRAFYASKYGSSCGGGAAQPVKTAPKAEQKDKYRREGRRCYSGDRIDTIPCRPSYFQP